MNSQSGQIVGSSALGAGDYEAVMLNNTMIDGDSTMLVTADNCGCLSCTSGKGHALKVSSTPYFNYAVIGVEAQQACQDPFRLRFFVLNRAPTAYHPPASPP